LIQCGGSAWIALIARPGLPFSHLVVPLIVAGDGISMAIPAAQNSVVSAVSLESVGKVAGINSMMRELGRVFGIAVAVAVFAGFGGYASAQAFTDGFGPAIGVSSGLALLGALCGLALPGRRGREVTFGVRPTATPAMEIEEAA
jgi:hypothetical protein